MSIRHDITEHVRAHGPISRADLLLYFLGRGERRNTLQWAISNLLSAGHLDMAGVIGNHRDIVLGSVPMSPSRLEKAVARRARTRRQARQVESSSAVDIPPALQPIWPAVNGAPIGGLRPCIA